MDFLINDPGYAPFGVTWLRGITPLRLGAVAAFCLIYAVRLKQMWFAIYGFSAAAFVEVAAVAAVTFAAALPMFVLVVKAETATARLRARLSAAFLALSAVCGALLSAAFFAVILEVGGYETPQTLVIEAHSFFWKCVIVGGVLTAMLHFSALERDAERRLHEARLARVEIELRFTEARLQLLQIQIEPHFIFNSLASVKRLYERDPGKGRELISHLRTYLREAVPRDRAATTTLGEEVALAKAFLAIFQVRMGHRLRVHVDVASSLERERVLPMLLGTLVENAIKHGISQRAVGGAVRLSARRDRDELTVSVSDDGVGFQAQSGHGVGLANIRARLEAMYGDAASLELSRNPEGGVCATLRMPLSRVPARAS